MPGIPAQSSLRLLEVLGDGPEDDRLVEIALDAAVGRLDRHVGAGVERDQVVVDRVGDLPAGGRRAVAVHALADLAAVREADELRGQRERDRHPLVGLVGGVVLGWPPVVGAVALHGDAEPGRSRRRLSPDQAVEPGRAGRDFGFAAIVERDRMALAGRPGRERGRRSPGRRRARSGRRRRRPGRRRPRAGSRAGSRSGRAARSRRPSRGCCRESSGSRARSRPRDRSGGRRRRPGAGAACRPSRGSDVGARGSRRARGARRR